MNFIKLLENYDSNINIINEVDRLYELFVKQFKTFIDEYNDSNIIIDYEQLKNKKKIKVSDDWQKEIYSGTYYLEDLLNKYDIGIIEYSYPVNFFNIIPDSFNYRHKMVIYFFSDIITQGETDLVNLIYIRLSWDHIISILQQKKIPREIEIIIKVSIGHELQHVLDNYHKKVSQNISKKYVKFTEISDGMEYRLIPTEINAFYLGAVIETLEKLKDDKMNPAGIIDFFTKTFLDEIDEKYFPKDIIKRLQIRAYKEIIDYNKKNIDNKSFENKKNELEDVLDIIKKIKIKIDDSGDIPIKALYAFLESMFNSNKYNTISEKYKNKIKKDVINYFNKKKDK